MTRKKKVEKNAAATRAESAAVVPVRKAGASTGSESAAIAPVRRKTPATPNGTESTALVPVREGSTDAPVLRRYRERRKFVAIRLRQTVVDALDQYVSKLQEKDDTVTRTEIVEQAIKSFLRRHGAYEE